MHHRSRLPHVQSVVSVFRFGAPEHRLGPPQLARLVLLLAALGGCDSDFEPYNVLSTLRVLAIESVPVAPQPGEVSTLTPLLHVPDGEVAASSWSWCPLELPPEDGARCPLDEDAAALALGAELSFELGSDPVARFAHRFDPVALARFCSGLELVSRGLGAIDCSAGLPIQIRYVVRTASDEVESVRRLLLGFLPEHAGNDNPVVEGVSAWVDGEEVLLDDAGSVRLPRDSEVDVAARVPESSAEEWLPTPAPPGPVGAFARERLVLTWFIDGGETRYQRTSFVDGVLPLERASRNTWTLPAAAEHSSDAARLIVVVRDDRGGVAWRATRVSLGGEP